MSGPTGTPVFFDPLRRRWKWAKRISLVLMVVLTGVLSALVIGILTGPTLPKINLVLPNPTLPGALIAHPGAGATPGQGGSTPNPAQEYQNLVATLSGFRDSATATPAALVTVMPINPTVLVTAQPPSPPTPVPPQPPAPKATPLPPTAVPQPSATSRRPASAPTPKHTPNVHPTATPRPAAFQSLPGTLSIPGVSLASFHPGIPPAAAASPTAASSASGLVIGFYVNWDDNSLASLRQNISQLDRLIPEWLHLADGAGTIVDDDLVRENQALNFIRQARPGLAILPLVNNINPQTHQWDGASLARMLADRAARTKAVQSLLGYVQGNQLAGICIDFENVPPASQADLNSFMQELAGEFHPRGLEVTLAVPFDDASYDAAQLAEDCDYLIFMGYDQHWSTSEAGPIAAQDWFASGLRRRAAQIPPQKLVVALGNYGYDWLASSKSGTVLTFEDVIQLAQRENAAASLDARSLNPTFTYTDSLQKTHTVWYLDAATVFNQLVAASSAAPRGIAVWRLGSEDPSIWQVLASRAALGQDAAGALRILSFGDSFYYQGRGEILKISTQPVDGHRALQFDPARGLITGEAMTAYPSPYILTRWGNANPKAVALTFDDGPSQVYTPQVLDILERFKIPGTFFIIGANGDHNPDLLKRIVSEGFEIGNHTYTHPDISAISPDQLRLELNTTQLLFESRLGIQSILFRPPYGEDIEPQSVDEVRPLDLASQMGYYTIGMKIDPADWRRPGTDKIVDATVQAVLSGAGNVILLHDGGGDRSQTVAALPQIIAELQGHGYHFVAVSDLMGLTRAQVMPGLTKNQQVMTAVTGVGLQVIGGSQNLISILFTAAILIGIFRMFAVNLLAVAQWLKTDPRTYSTGYQPRVSVIVPAYNEAQVIHKTVQSLLSSTYPNLTVIVVDDGSTDGTAERLEAEFPRQPRLCVLTRPNGGKASAINYGLLQTEAEVIVVLDADTQILPDAVGRLARHFEDPRVGAVAGNSKVGNRINLLTRWQALEYITSQNLDRRAFALLNSITVVPGAIGAWRRDLILEAGGFSSDTLAEDADLTLRILRGGHRIEYEDQAVALTEAPDTVKAFLKQRFRWMYGTLQAAWKYRGSAFRPRCGAMGLVALPNIFTFQVLFPLISPLMDLLLALSLVNWVWIRLQHPNDFNADWLVRILVFYLLFMAIDLLSAVVSFILEGDEDWRLVAWLLLQRFAYRQLMYYVAVKSTITALRGQAVGWGKLERKATVKME